MTKILFLGTGGYHPSETRHTLCLMLPEDGIVLDAGTGFFRVREPLATSSLDILLSHAHLDHCCGLTYLLDVLWEKPVERVRVHGRPSDLEAISGSLFGSPLFPMAFTYERHPLAPELQLGPWHVRWRLQPHPGGSVGYRFDGPHASFAYVTDTTADPDDDASVRFLEGVDLLIHECYFPDALAALALRSGHSTASAVGQLAARAQVGKLVLVHANPLATAHEWDVVGQCARQFFPATCVAYDGMIETLPGGSNALQ